MALPDTFRLAWTPLLKREGGKTLQAVSLVMPTILGSGGEVTLQVGRRRETRRVSDLLRYVPTARAQDMPMYLWCVLRPQRTARIRATWRTPVGQTHTAELRLTPARRRQVHVLFKTHLDLGYTHRIADVIRLYQTRYMEQLLANLDATARQPPGRRFVWMVSTWLLEQCLDPKGVRRDHLRRLERYVCDGTVVWGLMPFTTHSEFFGLEEMCRSLLPARRLAERFGRAIPRAAKLTDVPAHTASLGIALAAAGARFLQLGVNPESISPSVAPVFWWELPDGRRLLCHCHGTYGTPLLPPESWPWRHWLSVQVSNDNLGPQMLDTIKEMEWLERHFESPVCRTGPLESFADAMIRDHGREIPSVKGEFTDWWIHGLASQARVTALARHDKERLPALETADTLLALQSGQALSPRPEIAQAYRNLALYTEHTWGDHESDAEKALPSGNPYASPVFTCHHPKPPVDRWVASWDDKAEFARQAHELVDTVQEQVGRRLAAQARRQSGGAGVVLFNSLNWPRGGLVRMPVAGLPKRPFELVDPTTSAVVSYELNSERIEFLAPPVPACGYLRLEVRPARQASKMARPRAEWAAWDQRKLTLHSTDYALQFHRAGGLARWHDRARSTQWCSDTADFPLGSYLYEMPGTDRLRDFWRCVQSNQQPGTMGMHRRAYEGMTSVGPVSGGAARIRCRITPVAARVVLDSRCPRIPSPRRRWGNAQRVRTTFTLYDGRSELHVRLELFGKQPTYGVEAGYAFFPFFGSEPKVLINRVAQVIEPARDLSGKVNAAHMAVARGVRVQGSHTGMNFYPVDAPLVGFSRPGAYAFDACGRYPDGHLYSTLFNNCWGTNFALWQSGDFTFEYILQPTANDAADGGLARGGAEFFRPLTAALVRGWAGPASASLLHVAPDSVQVITVKPADFGTGVITRLWNSRPESAVTSVYLYSVPRRAQVWSCDLLERNQKRLRRDRDGAVRLRLRPSEVATLRFGLSGAGNG